MSTTIYIAPNILYIAICLNMKMNTLRVRPGLQFSEYDKYITKPTFSVEYCGMFNTILNNVSIIS